MEQQLLQLASAVEGLKQQLQGVSYSDFSALQQQVNTLTAAVATTQSPRRLKPARPDNFSSVRESGRPEAWLFTVSTYFQAAGITDPDTITFVATLLRGSAALWWQCHTRLVAEGITAIITTWPAFQLAFTEQFAPVSNVRHARDQLSNLKQTKSVAQYVTEFRMLILQIPNASEDEQLDKFIRGLKPAVRCQVEMRDPTNLQEAMRLADRADTHLHRTSLHPASVSQPAHAAAPAPAAPAAPSVPVPMDIGVMNTCLTPQEKEALSKEGRCFRCKKQGHRSHNCKSL